MIRNRVLLGMHHEGYSEILGEDFEERGYDVTKVSNVEAMLEKMGLRENDPSAELPTIVFEAYVMDANLGSPGADTYNPALRIYQHIERSVIEGSVKFLTITANADLMESTKKAGLNCISKKDVFEYVRREF